ncbi:MAG: hypothetical protein Q8L27_01160, partial [archaeon]|nr:hypothetical protein [archaeon]
KMQIENPYKYFSQHRFDQRYKKGRETFSPLEGLQYFVNRFIDFEIVEPGKNYALIKEMGVLTGKEFDNSLRRIFLLLEQMAEETLDAIKSNNPKLVAHMHDVDINLDKFQDYCIRILNRVGNKEPRKTSLLFTTLILLEMIGDEFKTISHHMIFDHPNKKLNPVVATLAETIKKQLEIYYDLFYKFDNAKVAALSEVDHELYLGASSLYKKADEEEKELFHHLRMIAKNINALVEIRVEMEF